MEQDQEAIVTALRDAYAHYQDGHYEAAAAAFGELTGPLPDQPETHYMLAAALQQLGRPKEALPACREALRLRPEFGGAQFLLAAILRRDLGEDHGAQQAWGAGARLRPDIAEPGKGTPDAPEAFVSLGRALRSLGHVEEAVSAYREAITLRPTYGVAQYNLGNALSDLGKLAGDGARLEEAVAAYREALLERTRERAPDELGDNPELPRQRAPHPR